MAEVSVIVTCFDRQARAAESVESVLSQTFRDFELLFIDGTGVESPPELPRDGRIRSVRQTGPGGVAAGRNLGLRLATGDYVAFLDADDLFAPNKLSRQLSFMKDRGGLRFSHTSYERIDSSGRSFDIINSGARWRLVYPEILLNCPIAMSTVVVGRDAGEVELRFDESLDGGEDVLLWAELARRTEIVGIDEPLTKVRMADDDARVSRQKQVRALINVANSPIARSSSVISALRRRLLEEVYLEISDRLWQAFGPRRVIRLDSPTATTGVEADGPPLVERDSIIRDLQWALERQAERFIAEGAHWVRGAIAEETETIYSAEQELGRRDEIIDWLYNEVAKRDHTITWLHGEVAERDKTVSWLHGEVAERDRTVTWLHGEVAQRDERIAGLEAERAER